MTQQPMNCRDCGEPFTYGDDVIQVLTFGVGTNSLESYAHATHYRNEES